MKIKPAFINLFLLPEFRNMKMIRGFFLVILLFAFNACKTNLVYISVLVPAPVSVSASAKTAGIINRSIPPENNAQSNVHHVLSGQTIAMMKDGSAEAIRGVKDALIENER